MNLIKRITAAVLLLAVAVACSACGATQQEEEPTVMQTVTEAAETETTATAELIETTVPETIAVIESVPVAIETPYVTMYFPGDWAGFLQTNTIEGDTYTVEFICRLEVGREQSLFKISFGGSMETAVGAVKTADGKLVAVAVETTEFVPDDSWTNAEANIIFNMLDELNDVMASLNLQEAVIEENPEETMPQQPGVSETLPPELANDMAIGTPYGELHYPSYWADYLSIKTSENDDYRVEFYCKIADHSEVHMFTIHIGGNAGSYVTSIMSNEGITLDVRVSMTELILDDSWNDEDRAIAVAMQEDLNYLLSAITG